MSYDNFTTFNVKIENAIAWVTFDYPPVNIQGLLMLADLNRLGQKLETDRDSFKWTNDNGAQFDMNNQRGWEEMLIDVQEIK